MHVRTAAIFVTLFCSLVQAEPVIQLPSAQAFALPPALGPKLLQQCSRNAPSGASEFWQASTEQIAELEINLAEYLLKLKEEGKQIPPVKTKYHRQYIGYTKNGERYIYGNFYPAREMESFPFKEEKQVVGVCDGGPAFWGIVYKLKTKSFHMLSFNGVA